MEAMYKQFNEQNERIYHLENKIYELTNVMQNSMNQKKEETTVNQKMKLKKAKK